MARPLRIEYAGAVYHITSRGNDRRPIFVDDEDRQYFLGTLHGVNERYKWICHAYCLMDNHYHILIETPESNLSLGMRQLNGVYTQAFNRKHGRSGHLFQGRFKAIVIQKDSHLLEACRYVVLNPVRAEAAKKPEEWKWSSYLATAGLARAHPCLTTEWILAQLNAKRPLAQAQYQEFVHAGIGGEPLWEQVRAQIILGEDDFAKGLSGYLEARKNVAELPKPQRHIERPSLDELFGREACDLGKGERDARIVEAVWKHGYKQSELADYLGMHFTSISRIIRVTSTLKK